MQDSALLLHPPFHHGGMLAKGDFEGRLGFHRVGGRIECLFPEIDRRGGDRGGGDRPAASDPAADVADLLRAGSGGFDPGQLVFLFFQLPVRGRNVLRQLALVRAEVAGFDPGAGQFAPQLLERCVLLAKLLLEAFDFLLRGLEFALHGGRGLFRPGDFGAKAGGALLGRAHLFARVQQFALQLAEPVDRTPGVFQFLDLFGRLAHFGRGRARTAADLLQRAGDLFHRLQQDIDAQRVHCRSAIRPRRAFFRHFIP
ncbi:MAG: hypothetical protein PHE36_13600, partial [Novosphingobium sp.]|nr:hypothetical protein [Novosphingobium sp.]